MNKDERILELESRLAQADEQVSRLQARVEQLRGSIASSIAFRERMRREIALAHLGSQGRECLSDMISRARDAARGLEPVPEMVVSIEMAEELGGSQLCEAIKQISNFLALYSEKGGSHA